MSHLKPIIELFILEVCAGKLNETPAAYRAKLKRLDEWMDGYGLCLGKLTARDLKKFLQSLLEQKIKHIGAKIVKGPLSPWTIRSVLMTVRHFLHWAYLTRKIKLDLAHDLTLPKMPPPDPKAIEKRTVITLLEAAARTGEPWEQARNLALLYVLCDTGGRIGAIIGSDIDNLDLPRGKLYVKEKGNRGINLFLNGVTVIALYEWLKYRPQLRPKCRKLFLSYRGKGLARSSIYSLIERIKQNISMPIQGRTNPHSFRHAWARDALNAGEDLSKVAATLGHSTIRVTAEYYARWTDGELKKAHSKYSPGAALPVIKPKGER